MSPERYRSLIARKLDENHLKPAAAAGPRELIRRIHFDLHGLPPPSGRRGFRERFRRNPDAAVAALTDELLASPRYGERWETLARCGALC